MYKMLITPLFHAGWFAGLILLYLTAVVHGQPLLVEAESFSVLGERI